MPREQRTQLTKGSTAEAKLGTISSEPLRAINMPTVTPTKSMGESLAEAVGLAAKAGAGIYELEATKRSKATQAEHKIRGNNDGKSRAMQDLDEIYKLPLAERNNAIMSKAKVYFDQLKDSGTNLSSSYFGSNVSAYRDAMDSAYGKTSTLIGKETQAIYKTDAATAITTQFESGVKASEIITTNKNGPWSGTSAQKLDLYVDQGVSYALAMQQTDPTFNLEEFITNNLEIKAPNNGPDLLKNASTGDKIRKLRSDSTSSSNTAYTKSKNLSLHQISLFHKQNMEPSEFNKAIENAKNSGFMDQYQAEIKILERKNKWDAEIVKDSVGAAKADIKATSAALSVIEPDETTKKNILTYEASSQKLVDLNVKTQNEHNADVAKLRKDVDTAIDFNAFTGSFLLSDSDNNMDYETLSPKKKTYVRERVRESLNTSYAKLKDPQVSKSQVFAEILETSVANVDVSKGFISSLMPKTGDYEKAKEGLANLESFRSIPGGEAILTLLPQGQRALYQVLNVVKGELPNSTLSEAEFKAAIDMTTKGEHVDYGKKISEIKKSKKRLGAALEGLPDNLQTELAILFDYYNQTMADPEKAAKLIKENANAWYKIDVEMIGQEAPFGLKWAGGNVKIINGMASPISFGQAGANDSAAAATLIQRIMTKYTAAGFEGNTIDTTTDDVRLAWDDDRKEWSISNVVGASEHNPPFFIVSHSQLGYK
jgi:hypothetical protein